METIKQKLLGRTVLIYGFIAGVLVVGIMFAGGYFMGDNVGDLDRGQMLGYLTMFVSLSTILLGINTMRKNSPNAPFTFWDGFKVGLLITLIASVLYVLGWMYYSANYAPDYMEKYMQAEIEAREAAGATVAEIENYKSEMAVMVERYKNPFFKAFVTFTEIFPVGLLVSLFGGLVFRRKIQQ